MREKNWFGENLFNLSAYARTALKTKINGPVNVFVKTFFEPLRVPGVVFVD